MSSQGLGFRNQNSYENFFELFNLPVSFEIDEDQLEQAYFTLQQQFHPDRLHGKSDVEREQGMQKVLTVNEAYEMLHKPLKRAEHILALEGIVVNKDGEGLKPSQALLMESLESREILENISSKSALDVYWNGVRDESKSCTELIRNAFAADDLQMAAEHTVRLRYLEKLQEEIRLKYKQL